MNAKTEIPANPAEETIRIVDRYNPIFDKDPSLMMLNIASVLSVMQNHLAGGDRLEMSQHECDGLALILKTITNAIEVHGELSKADLIKAMGGAA